MTSPVEKLYKENRVLYDAVFARGETAGIKKAYDLFVGYSKSIENIIEKLRQEIVCTGEKIKALKNCLEERDSPQG